jgi:hypothetical protein
MAHAHAFHPTAINTAITGAAHVLIVLPAKALALV